MALLVDISSNRRQHTSGAYAMTDNLATGTVVVPPAASSSAVRVLATDFLQALHDGRVGRCIDITREAAHFIENILVLQRPGAERHSIDRAPSKEPLDVFIATVLQKTGRSNLDLVYALYLLRTLKLRYPIMKGTDGHRPFLAALMLTSKVLRDDFRTNRKWVQITGNAYSLRELNQMECELCIHLNWDLNVAARPLAQFAVTLLSPSSPLPNARQLSGQRDLSSYATPTPLMDATQWPRQPHRREYRHLPDAYSDVLGTESPLGLTSVSKSPFATLSDLELMQSATSTAATQSDRSQLPEDEDQARESPSSPLQEEPSSVTSWILEYYDSSLSPRLPLRRPASSPPDLTTNPSAPVIPPMLPDGEYPSETENPRGRALARHHLSRCSAREPYPSTCGVPSRSVQSEERTLRSAIHPSATMASRDSCHSTPLGEMPLLQGSWRNSDVPLPLTHPDLTLRCSASSTIRT